MSDRKEIEMKCIVCKKKYNSLQETIKEGKLRGCKVVNVYCSPKCRKVMENKIKNIE